LGPAFLVFLLLALALAAPVPVLLYRAFALYKASYQLEPDGIRLNWGLRVEEIPIDAILWVRQVEELVPAVRPAGLALQEEPQADVVPQKVGNREAVTPALPLPWARWPGAVLGRRRLANGEWIEFLAATSRGLVLIATPGKLYAVSPENPAEFRKAYQRLAEQGALTSLPPRSLYPSFLLARVWYDLPARSLLAAGLALSLVLLVWVGLAAPGLEQVSLGFNPDGGLREPVPSVQLMLLPLLSLFFFLLDLLLGLFFYRRDGDYAPTIALRSGASLPLGHVLAYLLWSSQVLTGLVFIFALFFLLRVQ
jgi:hypothetical protein